MTSKTSGDMVPTEILELVFKYIDKKNLKDLLQMQLVCKRWSCIIQQHIYRTISLHKPLYATKSSLQESKRRDLLIRTVSGSSNSIGFLIENLDLTTFSDASKKCFLTIFARACPNLMALSSVQITPLFYKRLLALRKQGNLQHLERVTMPLQYAEHEPIINAYNGAMLAFKESITSLLVASNINGYVTLHSSFPLYVYLQEFSRLDHLHILSNNAVLLYDFDALLEKCSSRLKTIRIDIENYEFYSLLYKVVLDLSSVRSRRQVKDLKIVISRALLTNEVAFLMIKFPALESLKIINEQERNADIPLGSSDLVLCKFFEYLENIGFIHLQDFEAEASALTKALPILAESIKVKNLTIVPLSPMGQNVTYISLQHKSSSASLENDIHKTKLTIKFCFHDVVPMFKRTLSLFKDSVQNLHVGPEEDYCRDDYEIDISLQLIILGQSVDFIFDQLKALKHLRLDYLTIPLFPTEPTTSKQPLQLDSLIIDNCQINQETFTQISQRVESIKFFILNGLSWLDPVYNHFDTDLCMPFTTFDTVRLHMNLNMASYILIVWTNFTNKFFKVSKPKKITPLTSMQYIELTSTGTGAEPIATITFTCKSVSKIITMCGSVDL